MKHRENDFILPALMVIYNSSGEVDMATIKDNVANYITLNDEDMAPLPSRAANEPGYRQICGNMVSHKKKGFFDYVMEIIPADQVDKNSPKRLFVLNDNGVEYISGLLTEVKESTQNNNIEYCVEDMNNIDDKFDKKIIDYAKQVDNIKKFKTDPSIKKSVIEIMGYQCIYGSLIGENHQLFDAKNNLPYLEGHHLVPMQAQLEFFPKSLDRPCNIVPLCPTCHSKIHKGSLTERMTMVKKLYNKYIDKLNDDGIFISYEELFDEYYK